MKFKRLAAVLLAFVAMFAFACTDKNENLGGNGNTEIPDSGMMLMENSRTDYKILTPAQPSQKEITAAEELQALFFEATGVRLETVADGDAAFREDGKYISLGKTALSDGVLDVEERLGNGGFKIKTVGDDILIRGYKETGTLNGVYELLTMLFGFDYFYLDSYALDTGVTDIGLKLYDLEDIPDIEYNENAYQWMTTEAANRYRYFIPEWEIDTLTGHNSFYYVNPDTYLEDHYKWFDDNVDPQQLCYTAHGDSEEYKSMVEAAFKTLKQELINHPDPVQSRVTFAIQDNGSYCECAECKTQAAKYGTNAAAMIKFLNDLYRKTDEWFASEEGSRYDRELVIEFYAYLGYKDAPVKKTGDAYEAIDDSVKCIEGVEPRLAYLNTYYTVPLTHEWNASTYDSIMGWRAVAETVSFFWYNTNYHYYFAPYNSFNSIQDNYRLARDIVVKYVYMLSQHTQTGHSTGYNALNAYLVGKLGWDADADVNALTEKFFKHYFGDAADAMFAQFTDWRVWSLHIEFDFGNYGFNSVYSDPVNEDYFPQQLLRKWMNYYEQAYAAIEPLKETDAAEYAKLYDRIVLESLSTEYLYIEIYENDMPESELIARKREFKATAERLGMTRHHESNTIDMLWSEWGV